MDHNLSSGILVMKFGGTSLEDAAAFERVVRIVRSSESEKLVVVVSAMRGVTDALNSSFRMATRGDVSSASRTLEPHFERHLDVAKAFSNRATKLATAFISDSRREIIKLLQAVNGAVGDRAIQDAILSHGERLCARLVTIVLEEQAMPAAYVDARRCVVTNSDYGNASPLIEQTYSQTNSEVVPLLETGRIPVLAGFIGATLQGVTTTLGRGSSDYSATLVSAALGAHETQIWTDVDGVQTADPRIVKSTRTVPHLSYQEAAELARCGVRVLHANMIGPGAEKRIPIRVGNSQRPDGGKTCISDCQNATTGTVKSIAHKTDLTQVDITSTPAFVANGFQAAISDVFRERRTPMELVGRLTNGLSFTCEQTDALPFIIEKLRSIGSVNINPHKALISCVGDGIDNAATGARFDALNGGDFRVQWQSTSSSKLMAVVDAERVSSVVRRLHQNLFE